MPPALTIGDEDLQIVLAAPPSWNFTPGDNIIGQIVRHSDIVTPDARITLCLRGQSKVTFSLGHGDIAGRKYRSCWQFWAPAPQTIAEGPLHIIDSTGSAMPSSWPFSVSIPSHPENSVSDGHSSQESFLSLDAKCIEGHSLPGTFFSVYLGPSANHEAFVEYYLEAELDYISKGVRKSRRAVCPITVLHSGNFDVTICPERIQRHVSNLVTKLPKSHGVKSEDIFFGSRLMKKAWKPFAPTDKLQLGYMIEVTLPRYIQLGCQAPFPFIIQVEPRPLMGQDISANSRELEVQVNWAKLSIQSHIEVSAPDRKRACLSDHYFQHNLCFENAFKSLEQPIILQSDTMSRPLDIGSYFRLFLDSGGLWANGRYLKASLDITPDFVTYNIKNSNLLEWSISLTIAGKTYIVQDEAKVAILPVA